MKSKGNSMTKKYIQNVVVNFDNYKEVRESVDSIRESIKDCKFDSTADDVLSELLEHVEFDAQLCKVIGV